MYTQCPHCDTAFRIGIPQLKAAQGRVRCGQCEVIFNALFNLTEELPDIPTLEKVERYGATPEPAETAPAQAAAPQPEDAADMPPAAVSPHAVALESLTRSAASPNPSRFTLIDEQEPATLFSGARQTPQTPSFAAEPDLSKADSTTGTPPALSDTAQPHDPPPASPGNASQDVVTLPARQVALNELPRIVVYDRRAAPRLPELDDDVIANEALDDEYAPPAKKTYPWLGTGAWSAGVLGLLALLVAQYAYFMRADLAQYAALRPGLERLCAVVGSFAPCDIPLRRDLTQIQLLNRDLRAHPSVPDALLMSVTLINQAPFAQPYPNLQLTLADTTGTVVAKRRFQPKEYLDPGTDLKRGMAPRAPVPVTLEVAAPSINFQLASWSFTIL